MDYPQNLDTRRIGVNCTVKPTEATILRSTAVKLGLTPSNLVYIILRAATDNFSDFGLLDDPTVRAIGKRKPAKRVRWNAKDKIDLT